VTWWKSSKQFVGVYFRNSQPLFSSYGSVQVIPPELGAKFLTEVVIQSGLVFM
jgi:hypothetical protein